MRSHLDLIGDSILACKEQGETPRYIYMNFRTYKRIVDDLKDSLVKPVQAESHTGATILGLSVMFNEQCPAGIFWITSTPLYESEPR